MDTNSAGSHDRLRQAIDNEINSSEEFTRVLKSRRNALAFISRLPPETLAEIFSFFFPSAWNKEAGHLAWIRVTHVCRRWRETALNHSRFWSHIDFTNLTPAGVAEILARAKMAPLHLEADFVKMSAAQLVAFEKHLEAHISHTRHLSMCGHLQAVLDRLVLSAPALEFLSLADKSEFASGRVIIPINLFDCTIPRLTSLELENCDISWKSPLFKGLRTLEILSPSTGARPNLKDWLGVLNEMPQLETVIFEHATPLAPLAATLITEHLPSVTLPSLTRFDISGSATDCALALAHLVLPALISLYVDVESHEVEEVHLVIPYVAQNVHEMRDTEPLRSILISGEETSAEVVAWTTPNADVKVCDPDTLFNASTSARILFVATGTNWHYGADTAIFDSLLTLLPVNSVSTLTAQNRTQLSKEFWLKHAPRLPLLEGARLVPTAVKAFRDMLAEDAPPDGPRLPSLTGLTLVEVTFTALRTYHLRDMLIERVGQGIPLEVLDLSTCFIIDRAIQLLKEIVVGVQEPLTVRVVEMELGFFNQNGGIGYCNEVDYDDGRSPWYGDIDENEDSDESEAEYDDLGYDSYDWLSYDVGLGNDELDYDVDYDVF